MKSSKVNLNKYIRFDKIEHALEDKIKLQSLEDMEEDLRELKEICEQLGYWEQVDDLQEQLMNVWGQICKLKMAMYLSYAKRMFQKRLQKKHGDSKLVIVHEYDPFANPPRIKVEIIPKHVEEQTSSTLSHDDLQEPNDEIASKQEELDLYSSMAPIYDEYPEPYNEEVVEASFVEILDDLKGDVKAPCGEIVEALEEMVETSCVESVNDLEEVVEASFVEMIDDLKGDVEAPCVEVVETTCMKDVVSILECLEVVHPHPRLEVGLQIEQPRRSKFVKVDFVLENSPLADYVHVERFVEFNPTKIRGRIFCKKGRVQRVEYSIGNTSKLIFLVSLFNIWVWFIMQVRARAFFLTCVMVMGNLVPNLI